MTAIQFFFFNIVKIGKELTPKDRDNLACPWEWDSHGKCPIGWDGTARIAFPMNDNELCTLLNLKVNKVNKFYRFVSLVVRVVLSRTHYI